MLDEGMFGFIWLLKILLYFIDNYCRLDRFCYHFTWHPLTRKADDVPCYHDIDKDEIVLMLCQ